MGESAIEESLIDEFVCAYRHLKAALALFERQLTQAQWVNVRYRSVVPPDQLNEAIQAFTRVIYPESGRTTGELQLFGCLGVSEDTLQYAHKINGIKDQIAHIVQQIRAARDWTARGAGMMFKRDPALQQMLENEGLARVNLAHLYRHIPVASLNTATVSFSWTTHSRKIRKMTPAEALAFLRDRHASEAACQMFEEAIANNTPKFVAYATPIATSLVANLGSSIAREHVRDVLIRAPLPILCSSRQPRPTIAWPDAAGKQKSRKRRSDILIGDNPIVPGLRIFPYL